MSDQFPRQPRDDEEREACAHVFDGTDGGCGEVDENADVCTLRRRHAGDHLSCEGGMVLARWPQSVAVVPAPVAPGIRGTVVHRFQDGVLTLALPTPHFPSPRTFYVGPDELPGAKVGDRVRIRMEVERE